MCDMTHWNVWCDSLTCVTLIDMCDMTHWRKLWHYAALFDARRCVCIACVCRDSLIRPTWRFGMCGGTCCNVWHNLPYVWHCNVWHDSLTCVTYFITYGQDCYSVLRNLKRLRSPGTLATKMLWQTWYFMSHIHHAWCESLQCVAWIIVMCDMIRWHVWHDSFQCVTWLIHMCDMTHSYVWHDSFIGVTW